MLKHNSAFSPNVYHKKLRPVANLKSKRRAATSDTYSTVLWSSLNSDPHNLYTPSVHWLPDTKLKSLYASSRTHLYCYFDVNHLFTL